MPCNSLKGFLVLFEEEESYARNMSKFYNPKIQKISVIVEGKPNQLYTQGMRSFEQYDEICKYFAEGKQRDNDVNEVKKQLQLYDLSLGEYLVNKYALWLDFRMIDELKRLTLMSSMAWVRSCYSEKSKNLNKLLVFEALYP